MNKTLVAKYNTYLRIARVLEEHPAAAESTDTLKEATIVFQAKLSVVKDMHVPAISATVPITEQKFELFAEVGARFDVMVNAILLYAADKSDAALAGAVPASWSSLMAGSEVNKLKRFNAVLEIAKALATDLAKYGLDAALLAETEQEMPKLEAMVGSPRSAIDRRSMKNGDLQATFDGMDIFLDNRFDRAVRTRRLSHPTFVDAYFRARKLHEAGTRRPSEKEETTEEASTDTKTAETRMPSAEKLVQAINGAKTATDTPRPVEMNGVHA